jgi:hypothetical protein
MTMDAYTKSILTVIAACLVWICANGATPVARAQTGVTPTPVVLVDAKGVPLESIPVAVLNQLLRVEVANPSLAVAVSNATLPVSVRSIQRGAPWDPFQVHVMREPPTQRPVP